MLNKTVFGNWKVTGLIGEGGFGKVYKLEREEFGEKYTAALKKIVIPSKKAEIDNLRYEDDLSDAEIAEYFEEVAQSISKEIALMAKLKGNTNIVGYEDHLVNKLDEFSWEILIRMEYLTPSMKYFKNNVCHVNDVIRLGIDICNALTLCRKYNIVHRDIKPDNIMVSPSGAFKLGDFGIARKMEESVGAFSKKGTYTYMAPEVYKGLDYGTSVDIYSLGLVLYRLLNSNRMPFLPTDRTPTHAERETAFIRRMNGEKLPAPASASKRLSEIVLKACAYDPAERYDSPAQMKAELKNVLLDNEEAVKIAGIKDTIELKSVVTSTVIESDDSVTVGVFNENSRLNPDITGASTGEAAGTAKTQSEASSIPEDLYKTMNVSADETLFEEKTLNAFLSVPEQYIKVESEEEPDEKFTEVLAAPPVRKAPVTEADPVSPKEPTPVEKPKKKTADSKKSREMTKTADEPPVYKSREKAPAPQPQKVTEASAVVTEAKQGGKKPNKIIFIVAAVVILLSVIIVIAVSGGGKSEKPENGPTITESTTEKKPSTSTTTKKPNINEYVFGDGVPISDFIQDFNNLYDERFRQNLQR